MFAFQGYQEIGESLQYQYLRRIRGDNYCALRSSVFQCLVHNLSMPSGNATLDRLSRAHNIGSQWRFNSLPYNTNNVLKGMEICLQSLDNIAVSTNVFNAVFMSNFLDVRHQPCI